MALRQGEGIDEGRADCHVPLPERGGEAEEHAPPARAERGPVRPVHDV